METGNGNQALVRMVHLPSLKMRDTRTDIFLTPADWNQTDEGSKQGDLVIDKNELKGGVSYNNPATNVGTSAVASSEGRHSYGLRV